MGTYPFYGWFNGRGKRRTATGTKDSGVNAKLQDTFNHVEVDLRQARGDGSTVITITVGPSTIGGIKQATPIVVFEGGWEELKQFEHIEDEVKS